MQKKLTVKEILDSKGKNKLAEVYTHYSYEAEACELAGIDMIISSENNDVISIRNAAPESGFLIYRFLIELVGRNHPESQLPWKLGLRCRLRDRRE